MKLTKNFIISYTLLPTYFVWLLPLKNFPLFYVAWVAIFSYWMQMYILIFHSDISEEDIEDLIARFQKFNIDSSALCSPSQEPRVSAIRARGNELWTVWILKCFFPDRSGVGIILTSDRFCNKYPQFDKLCLIVEVQS